jgi:hypothetical protein
MRTAIPLLLLLAACSAYDEDIGMVPYRCNTDEPRCPDGYTCQNDATTGDDVCVSNGSSISGDFECADDASSEPNNLLAEATATGLDAMKSFAKDNLAICPAGDRDQFGLTLATQNESVEIVVDYQANGAELVASLLNAGGVPIATSSPDSSQAHRTIGFSQNLPTGQYYVQVAAKVGGTLTLNNYSVTITVATR